MDDFEEKAEFEYLKVKVLNKIFSNENIKKRTNAYVDQIYCNTEENRKIRKAFKNQLLETMKKENELIRQNIRVIQKKKPTKTRKRREYKPTPYVIFCREMRDKYPSNELSGKMQQLWRERNTPQEDKILDILEDPEPEVRYIDSDSE